MRACFNYAPEVGQDVWFVTKGTISKAYDHHFKGIFQELFDAEYRARFEAAGITYFCTLIDNAVAMIFAWSGVLCKRGELEGPLDL